MRALRERLLFKAPGNRALQVCFALVISAFFGPFAAPAAKAQETSFSAPGASEALTKQLSAASLALNAKARGFETAQEIVAAAQSDYARLIAILYEDGFYAPEISIRLDGREAASIPPLQTPARVSRVDVVISPGAPFTFGRADIAPLAPGTELPEGYAVGQPAPVGVIKEAANASISRWRDLGHAKAEVGAQEITAKHETSTLESRLTMTPGPELRFGKMIIRGNQDVRSDAITRIAGFPSGQRFSPTEIRKVASRLRRTGSFASVSITEAEQPNRDGTLDMNLAVSEQLPRRISFGGEIQSEEGLDISFSWMHRNLFGGAEQLRFETAVRNLGGTNDVDGIISLRLNRPGFFGPDFDQFYIAEAELLNETNYSLLRGLLAVGARRIYSDELFAELAVGLGYGRADDAFGTDREFRMIVFPGRISWDKRDDRVSATEGFYLNAELTPFVGFSGTKSGLYSKFDARGYYGFGAEDRLVVAARLQIGTVVGPSLSEISPEMLFYSGGAGTVRGQPYQSLGIPVGAATAGGRSFLGMSAELRGQISEKIALVGFYDFGAVDSGQFVSSDSRSHSGAGLGLRYTIPGIGPLRVDLAYPVDGETSDGLQFYIGIGQAF